MIPLAWELMARFFNAYAKLNSQDRQGMRTLLQAMLAADEDQGPETFNLPSHQPVTEAQANPTDASLLPATMPVVDTAMNWARHSKISEAFVRRCMSDGTLKTFEFGSRSCVTEKDWREFMSRVTKGEFAKHSKETRGAQ